MSVGRHFLFITSRASAYLCRKRIDERSVFKFVFAALATFLVIYTYIIQLSHISLSLFLSTAYRSHLPRRRRRIIRPPTFPSLS